MTTDPDFIHLIESKRFQTSSISSPKAQARLKEQQKAYSNELISLRLVPPSSLTLDNTNDNNNTSSSSKLSTTWNIPRYRLTQSFLTETVNRGRDDTLPKLHVTHLIDSKSKDVILPSNDLRVQCRSSPVVYDVVTQLAGGIKEGGVLARSGDSYYNGDLIFLIENVPKQSSSGLFDVQPSDVHRWLVECATSSVEKIMIANDKIQVLTETLRQLEKTLANVHRAPIYNDKTGRAITGEALQVARENKRTSLLDEQEQTKSNLANAEQALNELRLKHLRRMEVSITKRTDDTSNKNNTISFSVKLHGKKKEYYSNLITNQKDWSLPLYATGSDLDTNDSSSNDTSELALLDITASEQAQHFVNTGSVSIVLLPDGSGVYEHYEETNPFSTGSTSSTDEQSRGHHTLFHGHFHEGEYREGTLHTDAGVFSGTFQSNGQPYKGKMKYSDGTVIHGDFTLPPTSKGDIQCSTEEEEVDTSPLGPNPYRLGLPHGDVSIKFKDRDSYEGEMKYGTISGSGVYKHSLGELDGDFVNGLIQNKDGVAGQGCLNLPRSLLFSGERLWGP